MTRCPICNEAVSPDHDMTVDGEGFARGNRAKFRSSGVHRRCVDDLLELWSARFGPIHWGVIDVRPTPQATNATGPAP